MCYCGNPVKYLKYSIGYSKRCSVKCAHTDPEVTKKRKETCLKKYGVDSYTKTKENLEKRKETCLEKYGVDNPMKLDYIKNNRKEASIKKYGVDHHMKSAEFIDKFKKMNIEKFGVDNVSKLESIKIKKKETFQKNYGMDHIFSSNKLKGEYFKKKYGYDPYISIELKNEFEIYKNNVWKITYRNKKKLIENWNGLDYYDNEYIKNNYKLNYNNNRYPTIDHKISIYYGYINKIDFFVIGDITNLCITKKSINKEKGILTESQFKVQLI